MSRRTTILATIVASSLIGGGLATPASASVAAEPPLEITPADPTTSTVVMPDDLRSDAIPGRVLVRTRPGTSIGEVLDSIPVPGTTHRPLLFDDLHLVTVDPQEDQDVLEHLRHDDRVAMAEPDRLRRTLADSDPETTWGIEHVRAAEVWTDHGATGAGARVAVIDTGVDASHPQLLGRVALGYNAATGTTSTDDTCGHGTGVAGVVAANDDDVSIVGVAPGSTIVPVKVADSSCAIPLSAELDAIVWAADPSLGDADVINMSFGSYVPSHIEALVVASAVDQGVTVVAAGGNDGVPLPMFPAGYTDVISVAALEQVSDAVARTSWSSYGKVDVTAPGTSIETLRASSLGGGTHVVDGTSFSAPHVAGVAALLTEAQPTLSAWGRRQLILGNATDLGDPGHDLETGHGSVDAASAASSPSSSATLVTVATPERRLAANGGTTVTATLRISDAAGTPSADVATTMSGGANITSTPGSGVSDGSGAASHAIASTAVRGRRTLYASIAGTPITTQMLITGRNDEIPGDPLPRTKSGTVDVVDNTDEVFRVDLNKGEELQVDLRPGSDAVIGAVVLGPSATRVLWDEPLQSQVVTSASAIRFTAPSSGRYYLDLWGAGSYSFDPRIRTIGRFSAVSAIPSAFSPDGNRVKDATSIAFTVKSAGRVRLDILDAQGRRVTGKDYGSTGTGTKKITWKGKDARGRVVSDGTYTLRATWEQGLRVAVRSGAVRVDRTPSMTSSILASPRTFFPVRDGYRDTTTIRFNLDEKASVRFRAYKAGTRTIVRENLLGWRSAGTNSWVWGGKRPDRSLLPAGNYEYVLITTDAAGNTRVSNRKPVTISHRRTQTRTAVLTQRADQALGYSTNSSCGYATSGGSDWSSGIWMRVYDCDYSYGNEAVVGEWLFQAPGAVSYDTVKAEVYGYSWFAASPLGVFLRNHKTGDEDLVKAVYQSSPAWNPTPAQNGATHVSNSGRVRVGLMVLDLADDNDFDVREVRVRVTYKVLV